MAIDLYIGCTCIATAWFYLRAQAKRAVPVPVRTSRAGRQDQTPPGRRNG